MSAGDKPRRRRTVDTVAIVLNAVLATGCATFSGDGGFGLVEAETRARVDQQAHWLRSDEERQAAREEVARLLDSTLSAEDAVQIALLNNAGLQAAYAMLGVAEADRVQAGRLPNPEFSYSNTTNSEFQEIEKSLGFSVGAILTMPWRLAMADRRFETARLAAAADTVDTALSVRQSYFEAVAARQLTEYMHQVEDAAEASADLMERMARVGTSSKLELAREELFLAESRVALARAIQHETATREALIRALGLWGDQLEFSLPERLPDLPETPAHLTDIEKTALEQRLDVQMARQEFDSLGKSLKVTRASHFINLLEEAGPVEVRETGEEIRDGYELTLEIPVFDWGGAKTERARAVYEQGSQRLRETAVNARSHVREAYSAYRTHYDIAKQYRDRIVPLRAQISAEQLLRYNGMLASVFELITDSRDQIASVSRSVEAARDFWIAETALQSAMVGTGSMSMATASANPSLPASGGEEH